MENILGAEVQNYVRVLENERETALRVNAKKCPDTSEIISLLPFECEEVAYCKSSYYFRCEKPGNIALHHAGAFYVQEPSAMTPVACLEGLLPDGIKILDACASPGGKTSQAVCMSSDKSVVISNEIVPSRCKTLVGNIERQGFKNCIVTNADTEFFAGNFECEFALIICDAPCSGEGMFRKSETARNEWSEDNVRICSERQREILDNLAKCVDAGGYLLYSTCTFSVEENEENVSYFLKNHTDFSLIKPNDKVCDVTTPGVSQYCDGFDPSYVRRFYPHVSRGEGQFFALFKKEGNIAPTTEFGYKDGSRELNKQEKMAVKDFLDQNLKTEFANIRAYGDNIVILPCGIKVPEKKVFCCGVKFGEYKNGRIIPHHQFFSAYGKEFKNVVGLTSDSENCKKYLRGEGFEVDAPDGWAAVTVDGVALGGAKIVGGYLKNHYPKGLRIMN